MLSQISDNTHALAQHRPNHYVAFYSEAILIDYCMMENWINYIRQKLRLVLFQAPVSGPGGRVMIVLLNSDPDDIKY